MKMAKASEEEMESAVVLSQILLSVQDGYYPIDKEEDGENLPTFFDEDDVDHLKRFHELVMKHSGGLHRVTWGFHTLMHNDIVDPDLDHLELHPRLVAALAYVEEHPPVPEDQRSGVEKLAADLAGVEYQSIKAKHPNLWQVGDIVSRDGSDEQEILYINEARDLIEVKCIKAPNAPWCCLGEIEINLHARYSFVRSGNLDAPWEPIDPEKEKEARRIELDLGLSAE